MNPVMQKKQSAPQNPHTCQDNSQCPPSHRYELYHPLLARLPNSLAVSWIAISGSKTRVLGMALKLASPRSLLGPNRFHSVVGIGSNRIEQDSAASIDPIRSRKSHTRVSWKKRFDCKQYGILLFQVKIRCESSTDSPIEGLHLKGSVQSSYQALPLCLVTQCMRGSASPKCILSL
jgi:hypothetical protein